MDNEKADNDRELTSSMGSALSTANKDDKNDASDSTPTSSTDANNFGKSSRIVTDDPISSTSSDLLDTSKNTTTKEVASDDSLLLPNSDLTNMLGERINSSPLVSDADLLDMNITDVASEKITEDVEDIVQDLENLLGESSSTYVSSKSSETTNDDVLTLPDIVVEDASDKDLELPKETDVVGDFVQKEDSDVTDDVGVVKDDTNLNKNLPENTEKTELNTNEKNTDSIKSTTIIGDHNINIETEKIEKPLEKSVETPIIINTESECQNKTENQEIKSDKQEIIEENLSEKPTANNTPEITNDIIKSVEPELTENIEIKQPLESIEPKIKCVENIDIPTDTDVLPELLENIERDENVADIKNKENLQNIEGAENVPDIKTKENLTQEDVNKEEIKTVKDEELAINIPVQESVTQPEKPAEIIKEILGETISEPPKEVMNESESKPEVIVLDDDDEDEVKEERPLEKPLEIVESKDTIVDLEAPLIAIPIVEEPAIKKIAYVCGAKEEKEDAKMEVDEECEAVDDSQSAPVIENIISETPMEVDDDNKEQKILEDTKSQGQEISEPIKSESSKELEPDTQIVLTPIKNDETKLNKELEEIKKIKEEDIPQKIPLKEDIKEIKEEVKISEEIAIKEDIIKETKEKAVEISQKITLKEDIKETEDETVEIPQEIVASNKDTEQVVVQEIEKVSLVTAQTEEKSPSTSQKDEESPVLEITPSAEDILAEQPATQVDELQDNLETLLAVASVTNNLEENSYAPSNIPDDDISDNKFLKSSVSIYETNAAVQGIIGLTGGNDDSIIMEEIIMEPNSNNTVEFIQDSPPPIVNEVTTPIPETEESSEVISEQSVPTTEESSEIISEQPLQVTEENSEVISEQPLPVNEENSDIISEPTLPVSKENPEVISEKPAPIKEEISKIPSEQSLPVTEENSELISEQSLPVTEEKSEIISEQPLPVTEENSEVIIEHPLTPNEEQIELVARKNDSSNKKIESTMDSTEKKPHKSVEVVDNTELNNVVKKEETKIVAEPVVVESAIPLTETPSRTRRGAKKIVEEKKIKPVEKALECSKKETNKKQTEKAEVEVDSKKDSNKKQRNVDVSEPLTITIDEVEKVKKPYSPKITIKPIKPPQEEEENAEESKGSLKMTITKQSDKMHSILKVYSPDEDTTVSLTKDEHKQINSEETIPKFIIKTGQQEQDVKMSTRSANQRSGSPRITIKKVVKPETVSPLKITLSKNKIDEGNNKQKHSPKLTIRPIIKPEEEIVKEEHHHSSRKSKSSNQEQPNPKVTIKPIVKPPEEPEPQLHSPRITIKPIPKPPADTSPDTTVTSPRVTIKPVTKPSDCIEDDDTENNEAMEQRSSPKVTIKPVINPNESEGSVDSEDSLKERIVLKISKGNTPSSKESRKREFIEEDKSEKLAKIKLKFPKEGGHPHIVQQKHESNKRLAEDLEPERTKKLKQDLKMLDVTITPINNSSSQNEPKETNVSEQPVSRFTESPIVISEDSTRDSGSLTIIEDVKDSTSVSVVDSSSENNIIPKVVVPEVVQQVVATPAPRKRGRPRKVPLEVREDFKEEQQQPQVESDSPASSESSRPKRSCRGPSVRTTLGIKPRKPRGPGRGRGSKRGMGTRTIPMKPAKEPKLSAAKLKRLKESILTQEASSGSSSKGFQDFMRENNNSFDVDLKAPSTPATTGGNSDITERSSTTDIVMFEEETRMSADTSSRAQTPAKQIVTVTPPDIDESQSSVQSSATTESVKERKERKNARMEVHPEPEGAVISADQLAEYCWGSAGPFMLQEQVAQFLGIKSFKRKYPNIPRRTVDMQERDFIRESGLANEAMCDLGLTAVNSADILDIMYSDFQEKYEEYCKHQRDRQAKELINKQKALSIAASQEKTKMDITEQAVHSAAAWNANFNRVRKEQRKACMDLQTLTVHYPKGKMKQIDKGKVGNYPVAVVPGQFTDYYKDFTPTEINNFPLSTMCYNSIEKIPPEEMDDDSSDDSGSDSDSSSSGSSSSDSDSSGAENCKICNKNSPKRVSVSNN